MNRLILWTSILAASFAATSCASEKRIKGNGNLVRKEIRVSDFDRIDIYGASNVSFVQKAGKPRVEIYTSENIVDLIEVKVSGNTLYLGKIKDDKNVEYDRLEFTVTAPDLEGARLSGAVNLKLENGLDTEEFTLDISGAGNIEGGNLTCSGKFLVDTSGAADLDCNRVKCSDARIDLSGMSDIDIKELTCDCFSLDVSGAGNTNVKALSANKVTVDVSGTGNVHLEGKTDRASYTVSGMGDIRADRLTARDVVAQATGMSKVTCHSSGTLHTSTSGGGKVGYRGNPSLDTSASPVYKLD